jgi:hypothetical protein
VSRGLKRVLWNSLVAGPEMRYRPETARRGWRSALPELSERSELRLRLVIDSKISR